MIPNVSLTIAKEHIAHLRESGEDIITITAQARLALWSCGLGRAIIYFTNQTT